MIEQKAGMTEAEAVKWVAELFEEPADRITPATPRAAIPAWDSLGVLTLMAALDEKFNLVLSDADMRAMKSVGDVIAVLRQHGKVS